jgi:N-acetyl-anhydromuramyl-L-alanine amidase AmpD
MNYVTVHWTAGGYEVTETDLEHYHLIVDGNGKLHRGNNSILANVSTSDHDGYAAHTSQFNTKNIGISAACMANAIENPFDAGAYPLRRGQWLILAQVAAELCARYQIEVLPTTVMQHGEVQMNMGVPQSGKWDICKLPWLPEAGFDQVTDAFRAHVVRYLAIVKGEQPCPH